MIDFRDPTNCAAAWTHAADSSENARQDLPGGGAQADSRSLNQHTAHQIDSASAGKRKRERQTRSSFSLSMGVKLQ